MTLRSLVLERKPSSIVIEDLAVRNSIKNYHLIKSNLCWQQFKYCHYRGLHGKLSLWTVISNESRHYILKCEDKIRQVEARRISKNV